MFCLKRRGTVEYLEDEGLASLEGVTHGFCTRLGGVSQGPFASLNGGELVGDRPAAVRRNRERVAAAFGALPDRLVLMGQVHGDRVCLLEEGDCLPALVPECDGLITALAGVALAVKTADCVPLLFCDPVRRVIGVAHGGWKGTALGIAGRMVRLFEERFGTRPEDLRVAIGPAIGRCCYQVDAPVQEAFAGHPDQGQWLSPSPDAPGHWQLDLAAANRSLLLSAGIPEGQVTAAAPCTACRTDLFFSHRAEAGRTGRQLSLLMLTADLEKRT